MSRRGRAAPVYRDRLVELREQAEHFRAEVQTAQANLDGLRDTLPHPMFRTPDQRTAVTKAEGVLTAARQSGRNAERVLAEAEAAWADQSEPSVTLRTCRNCGRLLPEAMYYTIDGRLTARCRECVQEANWRSWQRHREKRIAYLKAWQAERRRSRSPPE